MAKPNKHGGGRTKGAIYVTPRMMDWMGRNGNAKLVDQLRDVHAQYQAERPSSLASRPLEWLKARRTNLKLTINRYEDEIAHRDAVEPKRRGRPRKNR